MPNPILSDRMLERTATSGPGGPLNPPLTSPRHSPAGAWTPTASEATMTIGGTCSASALMLALLGVGAWFGWGKVDVVEGVDELGRVVSSASLTQPAWLMGSIIVAFVLAMATVFVPKLARFTAVPYALTEGIALGVISHLYDAQSSGLAIQAVIATCGVVAMMLLLYGLRILRATPRFTKAVVAATFGVAAIYLVAFIARAFGSDLGIFSSSSGLSIGFSVVVVAIAAFNLILDFDFIERGSAAGLPKHMEWYGAFGLILTVVWLYLEILRLLAKLRD
ncbi:MAG: Bax inhibitor-1/YccA family protein [Microthrixaceae bacterium]|nr:Bax inhibitor-1/YccA family protein [Microthrixaceae bacterium]